MRVINWNFSYAGNIDDKIKYLQAYLTDDCCCLLQEVKPLAYECIKNLLENKYEMFYSLTYRKPSEFDSEARKLGVLILVNKGITIESAGAIERSPFPDRTLFVTLQKNGKSIKILALHSLTGCGYYKTKSIQYDSFTEFIDEYHPDIIGIDANEPQIDHYDIRQMQFFDNGPGAKTFFNKISDIGLTDAYVKFNGADKYEFGKPLIKSHYIRGKGEVRYDFLFLKDTYNITNCLYNYSEAVAAGSDHAMIVCDILI